MPYLNLDKILPDGIDQSDAILHEYLDADSAPHKADTTVNEERADSNDNVINDNVIVINDNSIDFDNASGDESVRSEPVKKSKRVKIIRDDDDEEEQKDLINRLKRWRMSFAFFDSVKKDIAPCLRSKVDKVLTANAKKAVSVALLKEIELELQAAVGSSMDSPPTQADFILKNVNPAIEGTVTSMGYDIRGFSQLANMHCKEPLVLALIEHDVMAGKKPSPLVMLTISYLSVMQFTYYSNKAAAMQKMQESKPQDAAPETKSAAEACSELPDL